MPNYTDTFSLIGAYARAYDQITRLATLDLDVTESGETLRTLDNLSSRFASLLNDSPTERDALNVLTTLEALADDLLAGRDAISAHLNDALTTIIASDLNANGDSLAVLAALEREMIADSESLQENSVALGAISADASNTGDGVLVASIKRVDQSGSAVDSQLVKDQNLRVICTEDSALDGVAATHESWEVLGTQDLRATLATVPVTAGLSENDDNHALDGSFSAWSSGDLQAFTAAGASLFSQETSDTLFNQSALKISGANAASLTQDISVRPGNPLAGRMVTLAFWAKVNSFSGGNIKVRLRVQPSSLSHEIELNTSTPTGAWAHHSVTAVLPADAYAQGLSVEVIANGSFTGDVLLDGLCITPLAPIGDGLSLAIFAGPTPFARLPRPDAFTLDTTSDDAGAFACFLRDVLGVELPASSSPTISDALAV